MFRGQKDPMNKDIRQRFGGGRGAHRDAQDRSSINWRVGFGRQEEADGRGEYNAALQRSEEKDGGDMRLWDEVRHGLNRGGNRAADGRGRRGGGEGQANCLGSKGRRDATGDSQRCSTSTDVMPQDPRDVSRTGRQTGGGGARGVGSGESQNAKSQVPQSTGEKDHEGSRKRQGQRTWSKGRRDGSGDTRRDGGSSTSRNGAPQGPRLGFKSLLELSEKEPSAIAFTLCSHPALPDVLLETNMRQDLVELLCLVLSKAFRSRSNRVTLQRLASILKDSGFFRTTLPHYLAGMKLERKPQRREQYPRHLEYILLILTHVLTTFPASSAEAVGLLLTLLQASVDGLRTAGVDVPAEVVEKVARLEGLLKHLQEKSCEGTLHPRRDTYGLLQLDLTGDEDEQPLFRTMPIYPTPEEFVEDHRPFLRPNITSQRYTNTLIYLDTHFRLMREDLVRRLREGIQLLRHMQMGANHPELEKKHFDDVLVYFDVKVEAPKCMLTGLAYVVKFDVQPLKFVRWENSKRLLYGSLVCLSCDHFESILYATVADRDPKKLTKGQVTIMFTDDSRYKLARMEKEQTFVMVETPAYFEAYRYVLEGLQEQDEDDMAFQRYIVECSTDIHPPAYLPRSDIYDLSSIAANDCAKSIRPFHSLDEIAWPKKEMLSLDGSQMRALQLALTKELAIIQGPPGTGKTHVGLKIAQALLNNQNLWRDPEENSPMLVVCYTNHALDQFLEGIFKFMPSGIVRVGGRSNSEILKSFNLKELAASFSVKQRQPSYLRHAFTEIHSELRDLETGIKNSKHTLHCSLTGILHENILENVMDEKHWKRLQQLRNLGIWNSKSSLIVEWLGLGPECILEMETEDANTDEDEVGTELEQEDVIEVAEEADLIQAERIIEDNIDTECDSNDERECLREAMGFRRIQKSILAMSMDQDPIKPEETEEEWMFQREQKKKMKRKVVKELAKKTAMSEAEEKRILDVWALSMADRWRLYRLWMVRYRADIRNKARISEEEYQRAADRYAEIKRDETLSILKRAKVIGMTTTGAAKYRKVLQEVRPRLVIVEEAAEVLEAHIITALSQACQHLILIGDHQQLRPSSTEFDLEKNYEMGVSMFERLVNMGLPFVRLQQQHRMRPEIARLLTPHIYKELENHPSVLNFDNIKGLKTNVFFVAHNQLEKQFKEGKSHQNQHEAMFVVALCRYLLLQEYTPNQITILTTYTAQLQCLRRLMPASQFSGVKVCVVDKYQGEENDIVLLSLVRSNRELKVGFLNISNRVCVALSRAKKGLYCIGNSEMLGQVKLWSNIFSTLREGGQIGGALTLCCQNHPERQIQAACADDFLQAPEGGCTQPCEYRLDCGHVCASVCHPYDQEHKKYKCVKDCMRILCQLGHKCPLVCHAECPEECPVSVEKIIPKCQHTQMVPCHQDPNTFTCKMPCQRTLQCGHRCATWCGLPCGSGKCAVNVTFRLRCGHSQLAPCFYQTCEDEPTCATPCEQQLKCGHACRGTCGQCFNGRFHAPCFHQCDRLLICSHKCAVPCTRDCPPCQKPCENRCVHSKCMKTCGEPCVPCREPCASECPHQSCSKLCHEPCDRPPCTQPCARTLTCGHPCIGLCGDTCPSKCRVCHEDEVTEIFFGMEDDPDARFIQLEDCGHLIELASMDTYMAMDDEQQANGEGRVAIKLKECPKCRTPIRKNLRYGSHINRSLAAIEMVKEKISGNQVDMKNHSAELSILVERLFIEGVLGEEQHMHMKRILTSTHITANDIWVLENKLNFLTRIQKLLAAVKAETSVEINRFRMTIDTFQLWVDHFHQKFTEQQLFDLQRELQRLTLWAEFIALLSQAVKLGKSHQIDVETQKIVEEALGKCGQFTEQDEQRGNEALKVMKQKVPVTGLGISDDERKMIVSAMNVRSGHWYQCPNGHVYVITECGGAMEARRCTDCDATIGGDSHRLASGNTVATVMDGAQHPAWSEANNLLNFGNLNLD
ncbi:NFX1-type zinc finger-containing protein 1 isoform X2 [Hippocampus comes]|nr:PREDICTED: NFX1-type zinc finger-containing protein 1 isoform X2 [Hippocampus comes]